MTYDIRWTPNRYQIRENPAPDTATGVYDSQNPEYSPIYAIRPDPANPERVLLTDHKDQTKSMVPDEARRRQHAFLTSLNERFYSVEEKASGRGYLHLHDRLQESIEHSRWFVASAWIESSNLNTYRNDFDPQEPVKSEHRTRSELSNIRASLNRQPSTNQADEFAARYLRKHPYPQAQPTG